MLYFRKIIAQPWVLSTNFDNILTDLVWSNEMDFKRKFSHLTFQRRSRGFKIGAVKIYQAKKHHWKKCFKCCSLGLNCPKLCAVITAWPHSRLRPCFSLLFNTFSDLDNHTSHKISLQTIWYLTFLEQAIFLLIFLHICIFSKDEIQHIVLVHNSENICFGEGILHTMQYIVWFSLQFAW